MSSKSKLPQTAPPIRVRKELPAKKKEGSVPDPKPGSTPSGPLYRILEESSAKLLEEKVAEAITEGWKVHGSPSVTVSGAASNARYIQALVRTGAIISQPW
jgi:hypothetical protein